MSPHPRFWPRRWWRRLSLRARLTLVGTIGLVCGLWLGGLLLVVALERSVQGTVDNEARQTATEIAKLVDEGTLPQPIPVAGSQLVQVVDARHRVLAASVNADRLVSLLRESELAGARRGRGLFVRGDRAGLTGPMRVVAVPAGTPQAPLTVVVARPLGDVRRGATLLNHALLVTYPLLVLGLAAVGWRVTGAVLRPVEELRRGAERITGAATEERLSLPPSQDEVHRLAVTLNDMLDRLAASRARQRAFVADAAHELRSPLASMRTQLEVEARLSRDDQFTADLLVDVERLARLVDDLLLLARADEALPLARTGPVELAGLLAEVGTRYAAARVPVTVVARAPLWAVGDSGCLVRVLTNLVDNAVRHAERQVVVTASATPAYHMISVVDDGPGIPEADRVRVFNRFTRLDDGRARDGGGSGLGLAIVRELVRQHGGSAVLGDAGPGLRVEVRLPRLDVDSVI